MGSEMCIRDRMKEKAVIIRGSGLQAQLVLVLNDVDESFTTTINVSITEPNIHEQTPICIIRSQPDWGNFGEWSIGWSMEVPSHSIMLPVYGDQPGFQKAPSSSPTETLEEAIETVKYQVGRALNVLAYREAEAAEMERIQREVMTKRTTMRRKALAWFEQEDTEE